MTNETRRKTTESEKPEKVKAGKAPAKKGMPSTQMAKMQKSSLKAFAQANVVPKNKNNKLSGGME